jgi:hypothetical protein
VGEDSTGEIGAEFALDEAGDDAALVASGGEEGLEVLLNDAVENGVLWLAPLVHVGGRRVPPPGALHPLQRR